MTSPIDNSQASLALTVFIQQNGIFPSRDPGTFIAQVGIFAGNFGPFGAFLAAGQILPIVQNTAFFSLLGTTYGGNGTTNFALPNLSGTALIGTGQGPGLFPQDLGAPTGTSDVTLTSAQLPQAFGGTDQPFDNYQPSLPLSYIISTIGTFPSDSSGGNNFLGEVVPWAGNFAPLGWAFTDGQLLPITGNEALFNVIGTIYGGDGVDNFALPDLRGRDIIGVGPGDPIGANVGQPLVTLTNAQVPISPGGSAQPFDNEQPSLALTYLIATQGIFPSHDGNGSIDPDTPFLGEIVAFAGNFAPRGWELASGQLLPINQNQALFSLLGTNFGGDGRTTFALPNLNDRTVVGTSADFPIGTAFGSNIATVGLSQVPPPTLIGQVVLSAATEGVGLANNTNVATFTDSNTIESSSAFLTTIDWGDGTTTTGTVSGGSGSFTVSGGHTYADEGSDTALVTITHMGTQIAPTGTVSVAENDVLTGHPTTISANPGQNFSGTVASFTDTNTNNFPSDFTATINWGDGTTTGGVVSQPVAGTFDVSGSHTYATAGTDNVTVTLTDDAPGTATATVTSTANVGLSGQVVLSAATEGVALADNTTVATFTDSNTADTVGDFTATIDWGDGTAATAGVVIGGSGSFTVSGGHTYADEGSDTALVTITHMGTQIAPTGTVSVAENDVLTGHPTTISANPGQNFSGTVASFTDTNTNNFPSDFTATINWGDGTTTTGTVSQPIPGTFDVSGSHTYATAGTDNVTVTLTDDAPGTATATVTSTANVGLSGQVVLSAATEGVALADNTTVATFTDSNTADTVGDFTATIDWGDGTAATAGVVIGGSGSFTVSGGHTYADEGSDTALVTITHMGTQIAPTGTVSVAENDVLTGHPTTISANPGQNFSGTVASFTDTNTNNFPSDFTATINWGDGTTTTGTVSQPIPGTFDVSGSHTYAAAGTDNVTVTLADDAPGTATATATSTAIVQSSDTMLGTSGDDTLGSASNNAISLSGGDGNDVLAVSGNGADTLDGGNGDDSLWSSGSGSDSFFGGDGNDSISAGGNGANSLSGGEGNDELSTSGGGADTLDGGNGDDNLFAGGTGAATLFGGDGNDTLSAAGDGAMALFGGDGDDSIGALGGGGADTIDGGNGNDSLFGGAGADTLYGGNGDDLVNTGTGVGQSLSGGDGNDTFFYDVNSRSGDTIDGGAGDDTFTFTNRAQTDIAIEQTTSGVTTLVFKDFVVVKFENVETVNFTDGAQTPPFPTHP